MQNIKKYNEKGIFADFYVIENSSIHKSSRIIKIRLIANNRNRTDGQKWPATKNRPQSYSVTLGLVVVHWKCHELNNDDLVVTSYWKCLPLMTFYWPLMTLYWKYLAFDDLVLTSITSCTGRNNLWWPWTDLWWPYTDIWWPCTDLWWTYTDLWWPCTVRTRHPDSPACPRRCESW